MSGHESTPNHNPVRNAAAEWLVKKDRGLTAAEQDEFLQWLAADIRHREALAQCEEAWTDFDRLAEWRPEHSAEPNPDLLARSRPVRRLFWPWIGVLAAAAAVAVVFAWPQLRSRGFATTARDQIAASSYQQQVLSDGSIIDLNAGTRVAVRFSAAERVVELLRGEAQFTVKKDPARPFFVRAGGVSVRAVGTAFNVRFDAKAVEVLVTEGRVQVDRPPAPVRAGAGVPAAAENPVPQTFIAAGQKTTVPLAADAPPPRVEAVTPDDMSRLLAWQPQLLDFNAVPLSQVVAEFNRRNRIQLIVADPELAGMPIVASFRSDNVDGFVRLLEISGAVRAERQGDGRILLRKVR